MNDLTKKEFISVLKSELKDRPTTEEVKHLVRQEISSALLEYPNREEVRQIMREELKNYSTKKDLESNMKQMGLQIIDAIERMMPHKADNIRVDAIEERVEVIEAKIQPTF